MSCTVAGEVQRLRIVLASIVTTVWLVGYSVSFLEAERTAPTELTGLMVIVLGWAFTGQVREVIQRRVYKATAPDDDQGGPDAA